MARSFDGVSRTISVIPTGPVYGRASILLRRILALLRRSLVVRGALLRFVERCFSSWSVAPEVFRIVRRPESRALCHCLHPILYTGARMRPLGA